MFDFAKKGDSTLLLNASLFNGWKNKWIEKKESIKLKKNYFVTDSIGNRKTQILTYENERNVFFQLIIDCQGKINSNNNSADMNAYYFDYSGRLFVDRKDWKYSGERLWHK